MGKSIKTLNENIIIIINNNNICPDAFYISFVYDVYL